MCSITKEEYEGCPGHTIRIGLGGSSYRYFIVENGCIDASYIHPVTAPGSEPVEPKDLWLMDEETRKEIAKYHDNVHKGSYLNVPYKLFQKWMREHKDYHGGFLFRRKNNGCHEILHGTCASCNSCS